MLIHILLIYLLNLSACSCSIFRQINAFTIKQLINFDQLNKIVETALGIDPSNAIQQGQPQPLQLQSVIKKPLETKPQLASPQSTLAKNRVNPIQKNQLTSLLTDNWLKNATPLNFFNYDIDFTKPLPFTNTITNSFTYFSPTPSVEPDIKFNAPDMIRFRGFKGTTFSLHIY